MSWKDRVRSDEFMKMRQKLLARRDKPAVAVEDIEKTQSSIAKRQSEVQGKTFALYVPMDFAKKDKEKRLVTGIASNEAIDSYGDIVRFEAMKNAMQAYMKF